eukprot:CAMPEP_0203693264 /NCGR_PEP_ID=MMETSP0091-20130426/5263_1 /ASSEMBLY_ACC=CAM_ASM_001089 /TAXON_ID=426623 /ORGANISM="Chaetoceros affinis, Strain CCMP159" /LENGTH=325 /DNA_ID=CAMNT_0050564303 /DNA_START=71 /DNA_END=1048 /DNA_ORIENTATION=+
MSMEMANHDSSSNVRYVSSMSFDGQDDDLDLIHILSESLSTNKNKNTNYMLSELRVRRLSGERVTERRDSPNICDRLYYEGKKKEKQRAIDIREKLDQENNVEPPKLKLATERSYTPMRSRPSFENVHENLYSLSKKKSIQQEFSDDDVYVRKPLISQSQGKVVSGRLYQRSKKKQQEGKKIREDIERKLAPRPPTPTKKIPLSKATDLYERSISHKAHTQRKIDDLINAPRESSFPKMRTQSRKRTSSRARSETPSRRVSDRSTTPSRRNNRSSTPSRRNNRVHPQGDCVEHGKTNYPPRAKGKYELPPSMKMKTREQSPDLRS